MNGRHCVNGAPSGIEWSICPGKGVELVRAGKSQSESDHQAMVCRWLDANRVRYFAVPNGALLGGRSRFATMGKLKREGLKNGVPDLIIPQPAADGRPAAVEMKKPGGRLTDEQRDWLCWFERNGWHALTCYGFDDAIAKLTELGYGVRLGGR